MIKAFWTRMIVLGAALAVAALPAAAAKAPFTSKPGATTKSSTAAKAAPAAKSSVAMSPTGLTAAGMDQVSPPNPFEAGPAPLPQSAIDRAVFAKLKQQGIEPANLCSDSVFVRRAYLDVIGTLPTAQEAKDFLLDKDPAKRRLLIDRLLEREEYVDYWTMKWDDLLRVKAEFPINLWPNAVQAYHQWLRACMRENMPYDRFVRELLTSSGSNFRVPPVNFYRAVQSRDPAGLAQAVALTFMGMRADKMPKERLTAMGVFFSRVGYKSTLEWKEEFVFFDTTKPATANATLPDGTAVALPPDRDPREVFAGWFLTPTNPYFTKNIVNRAWSWTVGRGVIHEPDDIRPDNPASNPELLAALERELITARYDMKALLRVILNSTTYQLSSIPRSGDPKAPDPKGEMYFARYGLRRLEAEVLIDALCQITGTTEQYSSPIPEPFTFIPGSHRSIALPDGSITSSFLETFGRPARDTGLESERSGRATAGQRLHLLNSTHIQRKIEQSGKLQKMMSARNTPRETATAIYLTVLSRFPTEEELKVATAYAQSSSAKGREAAQDLVWALVNSAEFLYRH